MPVFIHIKIYSPNENEKIKVTLTDHSQQRIETFQHVLSDES